MNTRISIMCATHGIKYIEKHAAEPIDMYMPLGSMFEYTMHVWRDGSIMMVGLEGSAGMLFREQAC